ncbi:hypothetical protein DFP73DRAFT_524815 [Morchella snyderi]|nr:hypothetical protein DFP73DRAFT_524815 [Morchella snyderi]
MLVDHVELTEEEKEIARHNAQMAQYQAQRGRVCTHYYCGRQVCIFWENGMPATNVPHLLGPSRVFEPQRMTGPNAIPTSYRINPDTDSDNSADSYRTPSLSDNDSESENQMAVSEASKKGGRARGIVRFNGSGSSDDEEQEPEPARSPRSAPRLAGPSQPTTGPVYPPMAVPRPVEHSLPALGQIYPSMSVPTPGEHSMPTMGPGYPPMGVPRPAPRAVEPPVFRRQLSAESFPGGSDWGYAPNPNYSQSTEEVSSSGSGDAIAATLPPRSPTPPLSSEAPMSNRQLLAGAPSPPFTRPATVYTPQQLRDGVIHSMTVININELPNDNPNISSFHVTTHQIGDVARR